MSKTIELIKKYKPANAQEEVDKAFFIESEQKEQILTRGNKHCHLCSMSVVVNFERTKLLCVYHNLFSAWALPGGHADGEDDILKVAIKEVQEETSIKGLKSLSLEPISIDSLPIAGHFKNGKYVPAHTHLCLAYLFEADENSPIHKCEAENSAVGWKTFEELKSFSSEHHMQPVYDKIIEKIKNFSFDKK